MFCQPELFSFSHHVAELERGGVCPLSRCGEASKEREAGDKEHGDRQMEEEGDPSGTV